MPGALDFHSFLIADSVGSRTPLTMAEVSRRVTSAATSEVAVAELVRDGLTKEQASLAVHLYQAHNTLETEGVWKGLTSRQRKLAELDAADNIYLGASPEHTIKQLVAEGFTNEQAFEAVQKYLSEHRSKQQSEAPKMIMIGALVAVLGVGFTVVSASLASSHYKIYVGAIVAGVLMIIVGIYRSMKT